MTNGRPRIRMLADGRRLHLNDGPIDVIVEAFGSAGEVEAAYRAVASRFSSVLEELCDELPSLRCRATEDMLPFSGKIANRMLAAVKPFASYTFITPMAAVAGAVAEELLEAMTSAARISRAYANDGGDIALHLTAGEEFIAAMVNLPHNSSDTTPENAGTIGQNLVGTTTIDFAQTIRGIATSGWRGRSFSLGIADAVTILADTAAMADAAATIVANAVDLPGHQGIGRIPANEIAPDTDLGERLVTRSVAVLDASERDEALSTGMRVAKSLQGSGLIRGAALVLQGETRVACTEGCGIREVAA